MPREYRFSLGLFFFQTIILQALADGPPKVPEPIQQIAVDISPSLFELPDVKTLSNREKQKLSKARGEVSDDLPQRALEAYGKNEVLQALRTVVMPSISSAAPESAVFDLLPPEEGDDVPNGTAVLIMAAKKLEGVKAKYREEEQQELPLKEKFFPKAGPKGDVVMLYNDVRLRKYFDLSGLSGQQVKEKIRKKFAPFSALMGDQADALAEFAAGVVESLLRKPGTHRDILAGLEDKIMNRFLEELMRNMGPQLKEGSRKMEKVLSDARQETAAAAREETH